MLKFYYCGAPNPKVALFLEEAGRSIEVAALVLADAAVMAIFGVSRFPCNLDRDRLSA